LTLSWPEFSAGSIGVFSVRMMSPASSLSAIFMTVMPVSVWPSRITRCTGAAPRYSGNSDAWALIMPNFGNASISGLRMTP
jgi:hypothetical protein